MRQKVSAAETAVNRSASHPKLARGLKDPRNFRERNIGIGYSRTIGLKIDLYRGFQNLSCISSDLSLVSFNMVLKKKQKPTGVHQVSSIYIYISCCFCRS